MDAGPAFVRAVEANDPEAMKATSLALYDMARDLIALRHREPLDAGTDPTSAIPGRPHRRRAVPDAMAIGMVRQVLVVGIVAPLVMTATSASTWPSTPSCTRSSGRSPNACPPLSKSSCAFTPYRGFARTANRDVEIGGRPIRAGEPIALVYASANRDEACSRTPTPSSSTAPTSRDHIAFGRGAHYCAGAALGPADARVAGGAAQRHRAWSWPRRR